MSKYLLCAIEKDFDISDYQNLFSNYSDIHFINKKMNLNENYLKSLINYKNNLNQNISIYCFNKNEWEMAELKNWNVHFSIDENNLFEDWIPFENHMYFKNEFFLFLSEKMVDNYNNNENLFFGFMEKINQMIKYVPLAFYISNIILNNINYIKINEFIKKINNHLNIKNKSYEIEKKLKYGFEDNSFLLISENNIENKIKPILLNHFGDIILTKELFDNNKNILKNKECLNCDLYENCLENHISKVMNYYGKKCWGPNLLKNS